MRKVTCAHQSLLSLCVTSLIGLSLFNISLADSDSGTYITNDLNNLQIPDRPSASLPSCVSDEQNIFGNCSYSNFNQSTWNFNDPSVTGKIVMRQSLPTLSYVLQSNLFFTSIDQMSELKNKNHKLREALDNFQDAINEQTEESCKTTYLDYVPQNEAYCDYLYTEESGNPGSFRWFYKDPDCDTTEAECSEALVQLELRNNDADYDLLQRLNNFLVRMYQADAVAIESLCECSLAANHTQCINQVKTALWDQIINTTISDNTTSPTPSTPTPSPTPLCNTQSTPAPTPPQSTIQQVQQIKDIMNITQCNVEYDTAALEKQRQVKILPRNYTVEIPTSGCGRDFRPLTPTLDGFTYCTNAFVYLNFSFNGSSVEWNYPGNLLSSDYQSAYTYNYWFVSNIYNPNCTNNYTKIYNNEVFQDDETLTNTIYVDSGFSPEFEANNPSDISVVTAVFNICIIIAGLYYIFMNEVVISVIMDWLSTSYLGKAILNRF